MSEPRNADATCCRTGWVGHNAITFDLMGDTFSCVELRSTSMVLMNSFPLDCTVDKIGRWSNGELDARPMNGLFQLNIFNSKFHCTMNDTILYVSKRSQCR
jgi:hypothetical protein